MTTAVARVVLFHEPEFKDHFEAFELELPAGRHWDAGSTSTGEGTFRLFRLSNEDLQTIAAAAQGEIDRRRGVSIGFDAACLCSCHREPFPDCDRGPQEKPR